MSPFGQQINLVFMRLMLFWSSATRIKFHQHWRRWLSFCPSGAFRGPSPSSQLCFPELKQGSIDGINEDSDGTNGHNCKSILIEGFQEATVVGG